VPVRAAIYHEHGGPEVLRYEDVADPSPGDGEVVVGVAVTGLNRLDLLQRQGPGMMPGYSLPHIAGMDVAGEVVDVGPGVPRSRVGERVVINPAIACGVCDFCRRGMDHLCGAKSIVGGNRPGGYGALCVVPATHIHRVADHVELVEAASLPTVFSLAWHALFETGRLAIGETLMVHAAASGVTTAAVQLAKRAGARVVVTARTDEELDHARRYGADEFINTTDHDVVAAVRELTRGRGVDMVFDHLGPALFSASIRSLRPKGRLVFCGTTTGATVELLLPEVYRFGVALLGSESYGYDEFGRMLEYCWDAGLTSIVDRVLPISEVAQAHRLMAGDALRGKLVMTH
jgi:NADPH:quinone reductase-like Zn-dependent oxidoreductase